MATQVIFLFRITARSKAQLAVRPRAARSNIVSTNIRLLQILQSVWWRRRRGKIKRTEICSTASSGCQTAANLLFLQSETACSRIKSHACVGSTLGRGRHPIEGCAKGSDAESTTIEYFANMHEGRRSEFWVEVSLLLLVAVVGRRLGGFFGVRAGIQVHPSGKYCVRRLSVPVTCAVGDTKKVFPYRRQIVPLLPPIKLTRLPRSPGPGNDP
jgi:hypothetical protein